uniref:SCA7 domain-containing protein n=1 Tax=Esox lucius TaxID=8010 RepID=A0A3P8ZMX6_ESOLU
MAALERRVPSIDDFVGQSWSAWAEKAGVTASEGDDCSKNGKKAAEAMSLRKEDMSIFGHYPGQDDFYLVVCSHCGQVVKPQAFEKHCERRHGPLGKLYSRLRSPPPASQQRPRHSHSPSGTHATSTSSWEGRGQGTGVPRAAPQSPSTPPQFRHKPPKEGAPLPPGLPPPLPPGLPPPLPPGLPPLRPPVRPPPRPPAHTFLFLSCSGRECDLDKHCGVLDPERKKVCTRLLTCNIHSIHQRRKVTGRSKDFDQLVAELKTGARVRERSGPTHEGSSGRSPSPEAPRDLPPTPHCRRPLTNNPAFSVRAPSPLVYGHISSDESEEDGSEEPAEYPSSSWHPKPAAVCSFGSHVTGHGVYTFDRRLHHLRWALNAMVEQHISAHLWRESRLEITSHSTAVNQSENSGSGGSLAAGPAPPPVRHVGPGRPPGPGRPKNPVGRPSKQQLRLREEAAAAALRKRKAPSQEGEHSGPDRNCILLQDRGRPPSTSSKTTPPAPHGLTNGTLSPGSKPRPQPSPSETNSPTAAWAFKRTHPPPGHSSSPPDPHSRGGDLGLHGRGAAGYEHRGLGKKRKGGSSEPSPPSKPHRLPSSPRSNYYPWKDSKGAALPGGVEKKMGTQKVG